LKLRSPLLQGSEIASLLHGRIYQECAAAIAFVAETSLSLSPLPSTSSDQRS
jgi:hypothetical protein